MILLARSQSDSLGLWVQEHEFGCLGNEALVFFRAVGEGRRKLLQPVRGRTSGTGWVEYSFAHAIPMSSEHWVTDSPTSAKVRRRSC